ncbi:MAG TPA: hypothetical protein VJB82_01525 [Candidatus Peribacterales bacterium]|nr:hypothetical protein [Candidatus Peribacterales bacterium]
MPQGFIECLAVFLEFMPLGDDKDFVFALRELHILQFDRHCLVHILHADTVLRFAALAREAR